VSSDTYRDAHFLYDVGVGAAHMALFADAAFVGATTAMLATRRWCADVWPPSVPV
jgi:hypothetical protein